MWNKFLNWIKFLFISNSAVSHTSYEGVQYVAPEPPVTVDLAWGSHVSEEFCLKVQYICEEFGWSNDHASWLMSCIAFESAYSFSPSIKNMAGSGATGLIQFMPSTALGLGTTCKLLSKMSDIEQLDFVAAYFRPYAKNIHTIDDMYMAILMPKYIHAKSNTPIMEDPTITYRQNLGLDANKDGQITKGEAASKVRDAYENGKKAGNTRVMLAF